MTDKLYVSPSPHLRQGDTTRKLMGDVIIALIPAVLASGIIFGYQSLIVMAVSVLSCVVLEYICRKVMKRDNTVTDLSAVVTGILLAFNLPVSIPLWMVFFGAVVAIVVVKQMFGGIGQNFVNPALAGRIVLMGSFPTEMNNWVEPLQWRGADAVSSATPLALLANGGDISAYTKTELLFGMRPGCLGETCALALLLGFVYLVIRRVISPIVPVTFVGTVFVVTWLCGQNPVYHILSGGLLLGAIFMATDYTTSPVNKAGKVVFAVGCGLLTVLIRLCGSLPEGVSFAIVIMNILVPLIERFTRPLPFGEKRRWLHRAK